jgi:hypothetical protein
MNIIVLLAGGNMSNEEIIEQEYGKGFYLTRMLDIARADERSKLAGLYFSKEAVDAMIAEERGKFAQAIELLRDLADLQNGAPLERYREEWEKTIKDVYNFLEKHEGECEAFEIRECEV